MNLNFRIKDLLITVLPTNLGTDCDAGCSNPGSGCTNNSGGDRGDPDWLIDPAELIEMKGALQQIVARIDVALYNRRILPESEKEKGMLREKLTEALDQLKESR